MKTITTVTENKLGLKKTFSISASHVSGNFYSLKIESDFEIENLANGHADLTNEGSLRNYTMDNFKLKNNSISQIVITPKGGNKKDRFTIQINNNDLR